MLDERWIRSLHVESMRHADLHAERAAHVLFQASTIGALLDGAFDGDLTFAELGERGDLGLGTLNGLDGEMIAIDGEFLRADVDGDVTPVGAGERTPFAVVTRFEPTVEAELAGGARPRSDPGGARRAGAGRGSLVRGAPRRPLRAGARPLGPAAGAALPAARRGRRRPARLRAHRRRGLDGRLPLPRLRRGDRGGRLPPPLRRRRPRRRGGHVLGSRSAGPLRARIDPSDDLHVELPPAVDLADPDLAAATHAAIDSVEHGG